MPSFTSSRASRRTGPPSGALLGAILGAAALVCAAGSPAFAHPHIWIDVKLSFVTDTGGAITAIEQEWHFDDFYSSLVTQGAPRDADGRPDGFTLMTIAETNRATLLEVDFFTTLEAQGERLSLEPPRDHRVTWVDDRVLMRFTTALSRPVPADGDFRLELWDDSFFTSIRILAEDDVVLAAHEGCSLALTRASTLTIAEIGSLPETLFESLAAVPTDLADGFRNTIERTCTGATGGTR